MEGMFVLLLLCVSVNYVQLNFYNSHFKCYLDEQKEVAGSALRCYNCGIYNIVEFLVSY